VRSPTGGRDYLRWQAEKNPVAFMGLVGKVLPLQVHASSTRVNLLEQLATEAARIRQQRAAALPAPAGSSAPIIDAQPVKPAEPPKLN
jgi:hypothetical protein